MLFHQTYQENNPSRALWKSVKWIHTTHTGKEREATVVTKGGKSKPSAVSVGKNGQVFKKWVIGKSKVSVYSNTGLQVPIRGA